MTFCLWRKFSSCFKEANEVGEHPGVRLMAGGPSDLHNCLTQSHVKEENPTLIVHPEFNCSLICNFFVLGGCLAGKITEVCIASVACGLQRHFTVMLTSWFFLLDESHFLSKDVRNSSQTRRHENIHNYRNKNHSVWNVQKRKQTARIQVLRWWEIIYLNCWLRNVRLSLQYLKDCVNKNLIDGFCGDTSKEWQWSEGWKNSEASWSVYQNMNNLSSNLSMTFDFFTDIDGRHYWLFASPFLTSSTNDPNPIRTSKTIDLDWGFDSERASTYLRGHWDSYATHR